MCPVGEGWSDDRCIKPARKPGVRTVLSAQEGVCIHQDPFDLYNFVRDVRPEREVFVNGDAQVDARVLEWQSLALKGCIYFY